MKKTVITAIIATMILSVSVFAQTNNPPEALCQDVIVEADEGCMAYVIATDIDNGSYDPEGDPITIEISPAGPFTLGVTDVTLTVTDTYGNTDSCQALVTVVDTTPPVITCPDDVTVETESPLGTAVPLQATATDNCDSDPEIISDKLDYYPLGVTVVTFCATDQSGNVSCCTTTVTVLLQVAIDIKPGSCPNPFNPKSKGVIPVAIVGTVEFDPTTEVVPESATLAGVPMLKWEILDTTQPGDYDSSDCYDCFNAEANLNCDLDGDGTDDAYCGDGIPDLILYFDSQALATAIGHAAKGDCLELLLIGQLVDGTIITGSDSIVILKNIDGD